MLCFLTTDAAVEIDFLKLSLKKAVDVSFNMVSIDGDTSPNDIVLIMANGMARNEPVSPGSRQAGAFQQTLNQVCISLAKSIAHDGEGATKLIEVTVSGAFTVAEARLAARTVVSSPLVKAAIHGNDPNWGRIVAAAGRVRTQADRVSALAHRASLRDRRLGPGRHPCRRSGYRYGPGRRALAAGRQRRLRGGAPRDEDHRPPGLCPAHGAGLPAQVRPTAHRVGCRAE